MEIRLDSCSLRSWRMADEESLVRHANSRRIWRNLRHGFPHPYTPEDARRWLAAATRQERECAVAIDVAGEAVGGIGIEFQKDVYGRSAEIGFWLGEGHWGRGIGTEAVRGFTRYAFASFPLERIFGRVFGWNPASGRVLEKCGYRLEGRLRKGVFKDGRLIDELVYGILREEAAA